MNVNNLAPNQGIANLLRVGDYHFYKVQKIQEFTMSISLPPELLTEYINPAEYYQFMCDVTMSFQRLGCRLAGAKIRILAHHEFSWAAEPAVLGGAFITGGFMVLLIEEQGTAWVATQTEIFQSELQELKQ